MTHTSRPARRVLISGASIAGPALAHWLDRYGFEVTVVEKAAAVRGGGYAIDVRGTAREAVDRMGLLPALTKRTSTASGSPSWTPRGRGSARCSPSS
ncbi:hypothetical protein STENM327S_01586 [Streptomyces tendae]